MPGRRRQISFKDDQYKAKIGLLIGVFDRLVPPSFQPPARSSQLLRDSYGGVLKVLPAKGRASRIWNYSHSKSKSSRQEPQFFVQYEMPADVPNPMRATLDPFLRAMYRLVATAFHVAGPFRGLSARAVTYTDFQPEIKHIELTGLDPDKFYPEIGMPTWISSTARFDDPKMFARICRAVFSRLQDRMVSRHLQNGDATKLAPIPTRLETSLSIFAQAMLPGHLEDAPLRYRIAIESLFRGIYISETAPILSAIILRNQQSSSDVERSFRELQHWRNQFVHGEWLAMTNYGDKIVKHNSMRNCASMNARLLGLLYREILSSQKLLSIFDSPTMKDATFKQQIFDYIVSSR